MVVLKYLEFSLLIYHSHIFQEKLRWRERGRKDAQLIDSTSTLQKIHSTAHFESADETLAAQVIRAFTRLISSPAGTWHIGEKGSHLSV